MVSLSFRDKRKAQDTSPTIYKVKTPSGKWKVLDNAEMMFNGVGKVTDPDTHKVFDPKEYVPISSHDYAVQPPKRKKKSSDNRTIKLSNRPIEEDDIPIQTRYDGNLFQDLVEWQKLVYKYQYLFKRQPHDEDANAYFWDVVKDLEPLTDKIHDFIYEVMAEWIDAHMGVIEENDIEELYNQYSSATSMVEKISAINIGLNAIHQTGGMYEYYRLTKEQMDELSNLDISGIDRELHRIAEELTTVEIDQIGFRDTKDEPALKRRRRKVRNRYTQEEGIDDVAYEGPEGSRNKYKSVLNQDDMADIRINDNALPLVNFPISDIMANKKLSLFDRISRWYKKAYPWFEVSGKTIDVELEKIPEENRRQFIRDYMDGKITIDNVLYKDMDVMDKKTLHDIYMNLKIKEMKPKKQVAHRTRLSMLDKAEGAMIWATPDEKYVVALDLDDAGNEYQVKVSIDGEQVEIQSHKELEGALHIVTSSIQKLSEENKVFFEQKEAPTKKKMRQVPNKPILNETSKNEKDKEDQYDYPQLHDQMNQMQER